MWPAIIGKTSAIRRIIIIPPLVHDKRIQAWTFLEEVTMILPLLLALAFETTSSAKDEMVVVEKQPRITIQLDELDLTSAQHQPSIQYRIHHAAISVCNRAYRGVSYRETVACVKEAIYDGEAQLRSLRAGRTPNKSAVISTRFLATEH